METNQIIKKIFKQGKETGTIQPQAMIITQEGAIGTVINMPEFNQEKQKALFENGLVLGKTINLELNQVEEFCFISEAWMSIYPKETKNEKIVRPSLDPKKIEVVIFTRMSPKKLKHSIETYQIIRTKTKKVKEYKPLKKLTQEIDIKKEEKGNKIEDNLLPAFVAGFL